jgi:hypothetical protein
MADKKTTEPKPSAAPLPPTITDFDSWTLEEAMDQLESKTSDKGDVLDFEYQGFDARQCFENLKGKAKNSGKNQEDFRKDMVMLISVYLMRGTNIENIKKKMNSEGMRKLNGLIATYGIMRRPNKGDDITIHRLASIFPLIAFSILSKGIAMPSVTIDSLPVFLSFPQAPALLLSNSTYKRDWILWYETFSKVINAKVQNYVVPKREDLEKWWDMYNSNSLMTIAKRQDLEDQIKGRK